MTLTLLTSLFSLDRTSLSENYEGFAHVFFGPYLLYFLLTLPTSVLAISIFHFFNLHLFDIRPLVSLF